MHIRNVLFAIAALCLILGGCGQKLNDEGTKTIEAGGAQIYSYDAFTHDYALTVEFKSTDSELTVGVFRQSDLPDKTAPDTSKSLASKTGKEGTITVDIPKGTPIHILAYSVKSKTSLWTKMTSKSK